MSRVYSFESFRIVPASREFWRGDQLVSLPPHVFDFLAYLIERSERAVGKDELVAAVWGKTEISDTVIGQTVLRLRRELGDDAKEQRILRTIPRFGYRWVAPLQLLEQSPVVAEHANVVEPTTSAPTAIDRRRPAVAQRFLFVVAGAAAIVASAWFVAKQHAQPAPAENPALVTAVMPAEIDPEPESAWMRLAVMDVVAARLRSSGLPSVPSEEVLAYLHAPPTARDGTLRVAANAALLITPAVHRRDASWEVSLRAQDASGKTYAVTANAQDAVPAARAVAEALLSQLGRAAVDTSESMATSELVHRIDAAILADDPTTALALIGRASAKEQQSAEVRVRLAKLDFRAGRLDAARERLETLLQQAPSATSPVLRASILNGLGAIAVRQDQAQTANAAFSEAITLLVPNKDAEQLGQAYLGRAAAAADQRRFAAAAADYALARVAFRNAADNLALLRVTANEGFVDLDQDRPAEALAQLSSAMDGFRQWGALNEAIYTAVGQINADLALLDAGSAMRVADLAATLDQQIDNPDTHVSLALARARALAASGRLHDAREILDRVRGSSTDPTAVAIASGTLARLELERGELADANALAAHAVEVLTAPSYAKARADAWLTQVRSLVRRADGAAAASTLETFERWAAATDDPRTAVYAHLGRAEFAHGRAQFETARDLAVQHGVPLEIAEVAQSHVQALIADHDLGAAAVETGRVSRWSDRDFGCAVLEATLYAALNRDAERRGAVARAQALAGERPLPAGVVIDAVPIGSAN